MTKFRVTGTADNPKPIEFLVQLPRELKEQLATRAPGLITELGETEAKKFETESAALREAIAANQSNNQPVSKLEWHWVVQPEDFLMFDYLKILKRKKGT